MDSYTFHPIGTVISPRKNRYDVPRQGTLDESSEAEVRLERGQNYEQALADLEGFDRVWLIYVFHLNEGWKPRVQVPRHSDEKIGVFATRAPYRPNPIGLSCVRLLEVGPLTLRVAECDLLDGTPILDIKPYLPYADSFPDAATGWVPEKEETYKVTLDTLAMQQLLWLRSEDVDILPFIEAQLEAAPLDAARKRVTKGEGDSYQLAYRTWRIAFLVDDAARSVRILHVASGYTDAERMAEDDPYADKQLHRSFVEDFPS